MSAVKEAFMALNDLAAMQEFLEDDLEDKTPESVKFHTWAVAKHQATVCHELRIELTGLPEFMNWFYTVLTGNEELWDEYNAERFEIADRLFNYYRHAYAKQVA
jgi:hypothetical protein